jgi:hypothetical protein
MMQISKPFIEIRLLEEKRLESPLSLIRDRVMAQTLYTERSMRRVELFEMISYGLHPHTTAWAD